MTLALPLRRGTTAPNDQQVDAVANAPEAETSDRARRPPRWRRLLSTLFTLVVVAGTLYLWPARFGGSTRLVIVSGTSMEPGFDLGDVVVARESGTAAVDDIVVFEVPVGEAEGMLVIHRIVGVAQDGTFVTQGDNRDTPDQWTLEQDDIVGEPLLRLPKAGLAIAYLRQWWVMAIVLGLLAMFLMWPSTGDELDDDDDDAGPRPFDEPLDELSDESLPYERVIDPSIMAEAEAWLDAQLAEIVLEDGGIGRLEEIGSMVADRRQRRAGVNRLPKSPIHDA